MFFTISYLKLFFLFLKLILVNVANYWLISNVLKVAPFHLHRELAESHVVFS
jgi:hypothetical protein